MKEYKRYRVKWEIDIFSDTPREAVEEALRIQRDPESIATIFEVMEPRGKTGRLIYAGTFDLSK